MRTVAYLRISTGGQALDSQRLAILDYAHRHGLTVHTFVEAQVSSRHGAARRGLDTVLEQVHPGANGEIQLTDAIALLLKQQTIYGYVFEEGRYDIGDKLDYLRATVELAIDREDLGPKFRLFLADLVQRKKLI